jgi:hypothetical protein
LAFPRPDLLAQVADVAPDGGGFLAAASLGLDGGQQGVVLLMDGWADEGGLDGAD